MSWLARLALAFSLAAAVASGSCGLDGCLASLPAEANPPAVAAPPPPPPPPAEVETRVVWVPGDTPIAFLKGKPGTTQLYVFLHGACGQSLGYVQSFQYAAFERGSVVGLYGDYACGTGGLYTWSFDLPKHNARIEAAFRAAEVGEIGEREIVLIGFSQGATLAEKLAQAYPARYPRTILIGAPVLPPIERLRRQQAVAMVSGDRDASYLMKEGARGLALAGVPARYFELPHSLHGEMGDGERVMGEAFDWLDQNGRRER